MERATVLLLVVFLAGCGGRHTREELPRIHDSPRITVQRGYVNAGRIDFRAGAAKSSFVAATASFAQQAHARRVVVDGIPGAVGFRVGSKSADASIDRWNETYIRRGAYVFRYDATFGYVDAGDAIIALPTKDQWLVVRAAATNGANYGIDTPGVIRWLKQLDRSHPFRIYGAGIDFVEARFDHAPHGQDALALARAVDRFAPDVVDQGTDTVRELAREMESSGTLYLWWD